MSDRLLLLALVIAAGVAAWFLLDWYTREFFEDVKRSIGGE